jgi:hypothetical protein
MQRSRIAIVLFLFALLAPLLTGSPAAAGEWQSAALFGGDVWRSTLTTR